MIGLLIARSALHAQERPPTRGERLALEGRCEVAVPELGRALGAGTGAVGTLTGTVKNGLGGL